MKNRFVNILFALLCISSLPTFCFGLEQNENGTFTIESSYQVLKFYYDDDLLKAKYTSEEIIRCNLKTGEIFRKFIFFDESTEVKEIELNGSYTTPIITNDLPSNGIFHSDSKLAYIDYRFNSKTTNIELKTKKIFNDFKLIDLLKFQLSDYNVEYSEIKIEIPKWLNCAVEQFNFKDNNIEVSKVEEKNATIYTFVRKNIDKVETFVAKPDYRSYEPHIMLLPKDMLQDNKKVELLPNLSKLYDWYNTLVKEIGNDQAVLKPKVSELTNGIKNEEDKIKAIYYFIQDNIKYIAFEHGIMGFKPESCQKVYNSKFGDCKGMANLAAEMFKIAGFDARLVWLGTSSVPYGYEFPSVYADNHMICAVKMDGKFIFIDPTEKNADLYHYADRIQGREVLIQDGDNFVKTNIPMQDGALHETKHNLALTLDGPLLKGAGKYIYDGNTKTEYCSYVKSTSEKNRKDAAGSFISKNAKNLVIGLNQTDLLPKRDAEFQLIYDITANNQVMEIGKEKYINLEFERPFAKVVMEDKRNCAFSLNQRNYENHTIELAIPVNHKVTYLPVAISEVNEIGSFKLNYSLEGDKLIYRKQIHVNKLEIPMIHFPMWKEMSAKLIAFYDDRIVLEPK